MAFTAYSIMETIRDGRRWAARLRFTGGTTTDTVLRLGEEEPTAPEIEAAAQAWMTEANADETRRANRFNAEDVEQWLYRHYKNVRGEIIRYCIANPTVTGAQMQTRLNAVFPSSPFSWTNLFALLQQVYGIPTFAALRDYIVAHAASMVVVE